MSSNPKASEIVRTSLFAVTQTAVGCGIGLLIAGKLRRPTQKVTAASLFSVGFLLAIPVFVHLIARIWYSPASERGVRRSLNSIRGDSGVLDESDVV
jgi:hypothetical protein